MTKYLVNPSELKDAQAIGYNHGIVADGTFYSAGQVPMDANGIIEGGDIGSQTRHVYANIAILLDAVGKALQDIAKVTTHIVDPATNYHEGYKTVYWDTFEPPYPAHTVLGVPQLAHPDYLVEVEIEVPFSAQDVAAIEPDGETIVEV